MTNFYLEIAGALGILVITLLLWLIVDRHKVKKEFQVLSDSVNRSNRDVAGMCTAAISVDERLALMDGRLGLMDGRLALMDERLKEHVLALNDVKARMVDFKPVDETPHPYSDVIQSIRAGATLTELMQNFGLSGGEATLLLRLHGPKS